MLKILCILHAYGMLDECEKALLQSEGLARKRKAEAKHNKYIRENPELHDAHNKKFWKQYAVAKQEKKGKKPLRKVNRAQRFK